MIKKFSIPLLDLKREYAFLKREIDEQIVNCFYSQQWILGEKVKQFEEGISKYLNAKYVIGVNSGTDALAISLRAIAIKLKNKEYFESKEEIITTPFTFVATAEAIASSGAKPVFVDIDPFSFNIDPQQIKKAITKNTVGIVPVHLFGQACEMGEIQRFAKENNLFIIEDVAQAFGAEYVADGRWQMADGRRKLGTIGNCGAFSFFPSKNLGAYGDAGVVVTNDKKIAEFATILRSHGQSRHYNAKYLGYNSRLDSLQAAILLAKLKYIDKFNQRRIEIAQKYHTCLKEAKFLQLPALYEGLVARDLRHVYNLYTIKVESAIREELLKFLNRAGIGARVYYPLPLHKMQAFKTAKIPHSLRISEKVAKSVLSLPINPFLRSQEIEYTCKIIKSFKKQPI